MTHRLSHISVLQTSKVMAVLYTVFGVIYIPLGMAADSVAPAEERLGMIWLLMPVVLGVMGFVVVALACAIYNFVAQRIGGIELTLSSD